jgi:hypothetical protein
MLTCRSMEVKSCKVTIPDLEGLTHTVTVTAATLYEAVALGLAALRSHDWTAELVHGQIMVTVESVAVEHAVRINEFYQWIERHGGSPAEKTRRRRVKEILGISTSS